MCELVVLSCAASLELSSQLPLPLPLLLLLLLPGTVRRGHPLL